MFATAIKRKQKKKQKQIARRKQREVASSNSDSESNGNVPMHNIEPPKSRKSSIKLKTCTDKRTLKSVARKKRAQKAETIQE
jgi:hypothetical protein